MKSLLCVKNKHLKVLFSVLFFGALWGIVEATLGSILHLHVFKALDPFFSSSAIIVPIAFAIMGLCYKKTNCVRSIAYMGIVAAGIKLISCLILGMAINPVMWIACESLAGATAFLITKPNQMFSLKGLGTLAIASIMYSVMYVGLKGFVSTNEIVSYLVVRNALAIGYSFIIGSIALLTKPITKQIKLPNLSKLISSPIGAAVMVAVSLGITVISQII